MAGTRPRDDRAALVGHLERTNWEIAALEILLKRAKDRARRYFELIQHFDRRAAAEARR